MTLMTPFGYLSRREGYCPLQYTLIREVLDYIHDDLRFTITRYGLGDSNEAMPAKLSIRAILNARLMDCFKDVLLSQSLREKVWPIVKSCTKYNDIAPWLRLNRCPYVYDAETINTANEYGIYRSFVGLLGWTYEGDWKEGKKHGKGNQNGPNDNYEGHWKDGMRDGHGKQIKSQDNYIGNWKKGVRDGHGSQTVPYGFYIGNWVSDERHGQGKFTWILTTGSEWSAGDVYDGTWKRNVMDGYGEITYHNKVFFNGNMKDVEPNFHTSVSGLKYNGNQRWPDGKLYFGEWYGRQRHGDGKQIWPDGRVYIGQWKNDRIHGYGTFTHPDGTIQQGEFINNHFLTPLMNIYE